MKRYYNPSILPHHQLGQLPKIQEGKLSDGQKGNKETISFMTKVARNRSGHPKIRKLALNILNYYKIPSMHYRDEALAIGEYIKNHVRYVRDPDGIEYLQDPIDLVDQMVQGTAQGDCDDMSLLITTLLLAIGHTPRFRAVRYNPNQDFYNHIYVVDYEKNGNGPVLRISIDAILKNSPIGTEVNHLSGDEYSA